MSTRLWEIDHPYYCNEGNYFASGCRAEFASWREFVAEADGEDFDMNLVFRWDWDLDTDDAGDSKPHPDPYYRDGTLNIFYIGQRKGLFRSVGVSVCKADEADVIAWLKPRWAHMQALWQGIADASSEGGAS